MLFEMDFGRRSASYYDILGVGSDSSAEEIRRAYRKLAMRWHPDKWARNPNLLGRAKRKFQEIQEAYSVLSDRSKRTLYDVGMYDPGEEEDEGFSDFVLEMVGLMAKVKREGKTYSLEQLQGMLTEMSKDFESSQWYFDTSSCWTSAFDSSSIAGNKDYSRQLSKKARWNMDVDASGFGLTSSYCN
uniref:J domain-containing protein n=1 Tax=Kalanchoe fedtschenkoi TaxID=63787 RepID=A0A7N0VKB8_KALFE